jgi:hypothetical protein
MGKCIDILALGLSVFSVLLSIFSVLWATVACRLKPKLEIGTPKIETDKNKSRIEVKIKNKRCCRKAINIKIEMCLIENDKTNHFDVDGEEFLVIPPDKNRVFKSYTLKNNEDVVSFIEENPDKAFRVRVYASDEYSGFGKLFEKEFPYKYNSETKTGQFDQAK